MATFTRSRWLLSVASAVGMTSWGCAAEVGDVDGSIEDESGPPEVAQTSAALTEFDRFAIGVIPINWAQDDWGTSCPSSSVGLARMFMDDEDDGSASAHTRWLAPFDNGQSSGSVFHCWPELQCDTHISACRVDGRLFKPFTSGAITPQLNYAVLKLGQECPNGSTEFTRHIDNEDDNNINSRSGPIAPNVSNANTTLKFCLFRSGPSPMATFPNLGGAYAVFHDFEGTQPSWVIEKRWVYSDDEDDGNQNFLSPGNTDTRRIIHDGPNTRFDLARVR